MIEFDSSLEGLHRSSPLASFSLVRTLVVVLKHVLVEIDLDFIERAVQLLSEGRLVKLLEYRLV